MYTFYYSCFEFENFKREILEIAAAEEEDFAGKTNGGKKKIPESQLNKLGKLCKQSTDAVLKRFVIINSHKGYFESA